MGRCLALRMAPMTSITPLVPLETATDHRRSNNIADSLEALAKDIRENKDTKAMLCIVVNKDGNMHKCWVGASLEVMGMLEVLKFEILTDARHD